MPRRFTRMTRRSVVGAVVGLAFAAVAGVGLAQVTTGSSLNPFAAESTTDSQATIGRKGKSGKNKHKQKRQTTTIATTSSSTTTTTTSTTTTTTPTTTTTTAVAGGGVIGAGQEKFDVCHKAGRHNEHTINIAGPAVPAHMAHGDTMGPCAMTTSTTTTTATTPTTTTTTAATTTTSLQQKPKKQPKAQKQPKATKAPKQHKPKSSSHGKRSGKSGGHGKKGGGKHK